MTPPPDSAYYDTCLSQAVDLMGEAHLNGFRATDVAWERPQRMYSRFSDELVFTIKMRRDDYTALLSNVPKSRF